MKKKFVGVLAIASSLFCMDGLANEASKHTVGVDVLKTNFSLEEGYGKGVFKKNLNQYNVFGQYDLSNNFLVEYGYGYMAGKRKNTLNAGDFYPGDTSSPLTFSHTFNSKIKQQFSYVGMGWNYNIPRLSNTFFSILGGLSMVKVNGWFEVVSTQIAPLTTQQVASSRRSFSKTMPSIILKAAINHKFTDHFGLRLSGMWQRLDHFRLNSKPSGAQLRLKNCTAFGIGVFYNI